MLTKAIADLELRKARGKSSRLEKSSVGPSPSHFIRCSVAIAFIPAILFVSSCGGGNTPPPPPPPQQAAAPTIAPVSNTYTVATTVTVTAASGTTVHCTTDGTAPTSASPACPSTDLKTNGTWKFQAYSTETGDTDSAVVTATFTISLPVAQSVSLPATLTTTLNSTIVLDSSVVSASSSCPPSAVSFTLKSTDSNTATYGSAVLAEYAADSSGTTFGSVTAGNAVPEDKTDTYNLVATCGSSTSASLLTVTAAKPTVVSATPSTCPPTSCSFTLNGTNYSANNSNTSIEQWQGTVFTGEPVNAPCPITEPSGWGGTGWLSPTKITAGYFSSGASLGNYAVTVINLPTSIGIDGGWSCTPDIYTVTATGSAVSSAHNLVVSYDADDGTAQIIQNGNITSSFELGLRGYNIVLTDDAAYIPQPLERSIAKIDLSSRELSSISTGDYTPIELATDATGHVYASVLTANNSKQGAILRVTGGAVDVIAKASGLGNVSLTTSGSRLMWITSSPDGKSTVVVHVLDNNGGSESSVSVSRQADHIAVLGNGNTVLVYEGGDITASVIDLDSLKETGFVTFAGKILAVSDGYFALFDGNIGSAAIVPDGAGKPRLIWTRVAKRPLEDLVDGFVVTPAGKGYYTLNLNHRGTDGEFEPLTLTNPPLGGRNP